MGVSENHKHISFKKNIKNDNPKFQKKLKINLHVDNVVICNRAIFTSKYLIFGLCKNDKVSDL
jgi:hypothetical protein